MLKLEGHSAEGARVHAHPRSVFHPLQRCGSLAAEEEEERSLAVLIVLVVGEVALLPVARVVIGGEVIETLREPFRLD